MELDKIFVIDWSQVKTTVEAGLDSGEVTLRRGVAYWTGKNGRKGIVQHLPFIEQTFDPSQNMEQILKGLSAAQSTVVVSAMASTGIIVAAIAIQTAYLGRKLDRLQETMDLVSQDVHSQNVLMFMNKLSDYMGTVESTRELLMAPNGLDQTKDIAHIHLAELARQRNALMSLLDNLIRYIPNATERNQSLMLDFTNSVIELLPSTIRLEAELYDQLGKFDMANHVVRTAGDKYWKLVEFYRTWCNKQAQDVIKGESNVAGLLEKNSGELTRLFALDFNQALLMEMPTPKLKNGRSIMSWFKT